MLAFIISIDITQNKHKHGVHWNKWLNFKSFTNWDLYTVRFHSPDCGSKPSLMHGSYQGASTTFPSSATAHCDTGYDLSGNDTVACQTSGTWSRIQATCTPVGKRMFYSMCTFVKFTFHALSYYNIDMMLNTTLIRQYFVQTWDLVLLVVIYNK